MGEIIRGASLWLGTRQAATSILLKRGHQGLIVKRRSQSSPLATMAGQRGRHAIAPDLLNTEFPVLNLSIITYSIEEIKKKEENNLFELILSEILSLWILT